MDARQRQLNKNSQKPGAVVFWLSRDQRAEDHWGLLNARQEAAARGQPLWVVFCLYPFGSASASAYSFMLAGLAETQRSLHALNIPLLLLDGEPQTCLPLFCSAVQAGVVYCDFSPLRLARQQRLQLADKLDIPLFEVDSHNIIPCWLASEKQAYAAYTLRPAIRRQLNGWLTDFPKMTGLPHFPTDQLNDLMQNHPGLSFLDIAEARKRYSSHATDLPAAGSHYARLKLDYFIRKRLQQYERRNDPNQQVYSALSPWIHFGQISAQRIALEAANAEVPADDASGQSFAGAKASFLEELIVRRELADNYCYYNAEYDQFNGFPNWARRTLEQHQADPRPFVYSMDALEAGETHDPLWNAAQIGLVRTGYMHGYLRMYWAKKILEWSIDPQTALSSAITLNDRYLLDGRDANGYTGIAWSVGGVHDRAWSERPVFGKIRYMSLAGCRRKFNVDEFIQSVEEGTYKPFSE